MDGEVDAYELLGVAPDAGEKELARAYRVKALQHHPDKNRDKADAGRLFHDVKAAYDMLRDAKQRGEYDERRRAAAAKRQRQEAMSGQRKRMRAQLERDEREARSAREKAQQQRQQQTRDDAARFRDDARRDEERRDRQMRNHVRPADEAIDPGYASAGPEEQPAPAPPMDPGRPLRIPDTSAIDARRLPGAGLSFADFELLTLMRMRQSQQQKVGSDGR